MIKRNSNGMKIKKILLNTKVKTKTNGSYKKNCYRDLQIPLPAAMQPPAIHYPPALMMTTQAPKKKKMMMMMKNLMQKMIMKNSMVLNCLNLNPLISPHLRKVNRLKS